MDDCLGSSDANLKITHEGECTIEELSCPLSSSFIRARNGCTALEMG
jgi:hypothetical protein